MTATGDSGSEIGWERKSLRRLSHHSHHLGRFYNYAPCAIQTTPGRLRLWWCRNERDGVIRDTIFTGETDSPGGITTPLPAFHHSEPGRWDSFHVCDPSVVAGRFRYGGKPYGWALFYLGNDVDASRHNQIGIALAESPAGPWIRVPEPVIPHGDPGAWGVGQPSAINPLRDGDVLLFYTQGDRDGTRIPVRFLRISDTKNGIFPSESATTLTADGLLGTDGAPSVFHNADFALHPTSGRLFVVREQHPHPNAPPRYIGSSVQIASIDLRDALHGRGRWRTHGEIGPELTGLARCHNAGFVRDASGYLPESDRLSVVFSSSAAVGPGVPVAEWTYNLWKIDGRL